MDQELHKALLEDATPRDVDLDDGGCDQTETEAATLVHWLSCPVDPAFSTAPPPLLARACRS